MCLTNIFNKVPLMRQVIKLFQVYPGEDQVIRTLNRGIPVEPFTRNRSTITAIESEYLSGWHGYDSTHVARLQCIKTSMQTYRKKIQLWECDLGLIHTRGTESNGLIQGDHDVYVGLDLTPNKCLIAFDEFRGFDTCVFVTKDGGLPDDVHNLFFESSHKYHVKYIDDEPIQNRKYGAFMDILKRQIKCA